MLVLIMERLTSPRFILRALIFYSCHQGGARRQGEPEAIFGGSSTIAASAAQPTLCVANPPRIIQGAMFRLIFLGCKQNASRATEFVRHAAAIGHGYKLHHHGCISTFGIWPGTVAHSD